MDRRRFLQLLGVAPLAFNANRVIFDMGANLWKMPTAKVELVTVPLRGDLLESLNLYTQQFFDAALSAGGFGSPEMFRNLREWQDTPLTERIARPQLSTVNKLPPWQH